MVVKCRKCGDKCADTTEYHVCVCDVSNADIPKEERMFGCKHNECGWDCCVQCAQQNPRKELLPDVDIFASGKIPEKKKKESLRETKRREVMEAASKRADDDVAAKTRELPPFVKADKVNADIPKRRY